MTRRLPWWARRRLWLRWLGAWCAVGLAIAGGMLISAPSAGQIRWAAGCWLICAAWLLGMLTGTGRR